ncbi:MAG: right-handed parallel beta-helix repeat-containing protein [marine benthic group bacterium]|nr:right-handed parallel beta-helix repeat-containing protein [Gemmatimonadota bacterium]MCL7962976.1 right-handed parallel beta-helix repeat-containing protein [Candidatus Carthagonibacter metallireducens]MCL7973563.1 right-handed parallel beta-helix repeat-containing protein [Gemmatimonadota bacterium]MCL7980497.1 right-handed parallel beta-helix repeat-containing protein [Gemmatimonadota bacterium]MCL7986227.1 right-handed parallel beta-helix repeat-containing protein [Gemmatimonadota bacter
MKRLNSNAVLLLCLAPLASVACGDDSRAPTEPSSAVTLTDAESEADLASVNGNGTVRVTSSDDMVAGSFRAAILEANDNPGIRTIQFAPGLGTISIDETVTFTGAQHLVIDGKDAIIDATGVAAGTDAFLAIGGGDLTLRKLTVQGADGNGVRVEVPAGRSGVQELTLEHVTVQHNGLHGVHFDDQANNSPANTSLIVRDSHIIENGFVGISDWDGIRQDEGGEGDLFARIQNSHFTGNGADGFEADEKGNGSTFVTARNSTFNENGPRDPADLDDGLDIDEAGPGGIYFEGSGLELNDNFDEGLDLDEEGSGDLEIRLTNVIANRNTDEGVKGTEDKECEPSDDDETLNADPAACALAGGSVRLTFRGLTTIGNGAEGTQVEEFGAGDVDADVRNLLATDNSDEGIQIGEDDELGDVLAPASTGGSMSVEFHNVVTNDNDDGQKIEALEFSGGTGTLTARLFNSVAKDNDDDGIVVGREGGVQGTLLLVNRETTGNGDDDLNDDGVNVTERP